MKRIVIPPAFPTAVVLSVAILPGICQAQELFSFVQSSTNDVLATLVVNELPADDLADFGALAFTEPGDAIFGFGEGRYLGSLSRTTIGGSDGFPVVEKTAGVLRSVGPDLNSSLRAAIEYTTPSGATDDFFTVFFASIGGDAGSLVTGRINVGLTRNIQGFFVASAPVPTDLNRDGFIDGLDLGALLGNFGQNGIPVSGGELNGTDPVDGLDLGILLGAWNPPPSRIVATIPEPTTAALLTGLAGIGLFALRRPCAA